MTRKTMRVKTCPQCGGYNMYYEAGMVTGAKYRCQDCNYMGAFVVERDVPIEDSE